MKKKEKQFSISEILYVYERQRLITKDKERLIYQILNKIVEGINHLSCQKNDTHTHTHIRTYVHKHNYIKDLSQRFKSFFLLKIYIKEGVFLSIQRNPVTRIKSWFSLNVSEQTEKKIIYIYIYIYICVCVLCVCVCVCVSHQKKKKAKRHESFLNTKLPSHIKITFILIH